MKKILMTRTERGSIDGINLLVFVKGAEYVVSDLLAKAFTEDMKCAIDPDLKLEIPEKAELDILKENEKIQTFNAPKANRKIKAKQNFGEN